MGNFDPAKYAPVDDRIAEFYTDWPMGSIRTRVLDVDEKSILVQARCYRTIEEARDGIYTSGIAHEVQGSGPVNRTNHVENAETSAIGRALANLGYSGAIDGKRAPRPSREEMQQAEARKTAISAHQKALDFIRETAARCEPDVALKLDGYPLPIQAATKDAWPSLKRDREAALKFAAALAEATGETFNP